MISCPTCHAQNEVGATFCDQCGGPLSNASAQPPAPMMQPAVTPMGAGAPSAGGSTCPSCGAAATPGEAFCDDCGAALTNAVSATPGPIPTPPVQPMTPQVQQQPIYPPQTPPVAPTATARIVASNGQTFSLSGKSSYIIGREDAVSGVYPDVDTTPSGGEDGGVSRRHVEITQSGSQWFIQDLNSANGTSVDNQKLAAGVRQPLNSGSQIRLGKWIATFQL